MVAVGEFLASCANNFIFFSSDVQTTTIAIAITGSLCCSIVFVIFHLLSLLHGGQSSPHQGRQSHLVETLRRASHSHSPSLTPSKSGSSDLALDVLCVRCVQVLSDRLCRYGMCHACCMGTFQCCMHKTSLQQTKCHKFKEKVSGPRQIDLSNSHIGRVPERMGFVGAQLTYLNLSQNNLKGLPPDLGFLQGLQTLHLSSNCLSQLPTTLGTLVQLQHLDLQDNQLADIPDELLHLPNLSYLNLDQNRFKDLTENIQKLTALEELYVRYNSLESLPDGLCSLLNLRSLGVQGNPLNGLPAALGSLVSLQQLDASHCQLTSLPHSIGQCVALTQLRLCSNRLQRLPQELGHLLKLQELQLSDNLLTCLPATMEGLPVHHVYVSKNPMETENNNINSNNNNNDNNNSRRSDGSCSSAELDDSAQVEWFPPLFELAARAIEVHRVKETFLLPQKLQDLLGDRQLCTACGGPVFRYFSSSITTGRIGRHQYPLHHVLCSPHSPLKCVHAPPAPPGPPGGQLS